MALFAAFTALISGALLAPPAHANGCNFGSFGGGTGTSSDPLLVETASHLNWLQGNSNCWTYDFRQTADISMVSLGSPWTTGIGTTGTPFSGNYDGGGYEITDLTITGSEARLGLFGNSTGTIANLGFTGNVSGTGTYVGGLVGYQSGGGITNSYTTGSVSGSAGAMAGLVAFMAPVSGSGGTITNSYATGSVTNASNASGVSVGGLVSYNHGIITSSFATGTVTLSGSPTTSASVGGLVASQDLTVRNSYSTGAVRMTGTPPATTRVGGLVGFLRGELTDSYSTGSVSQVGTYGGLIGVDSGEAPGESGSFWDTQTSGLASSDGGTGKTTEQMKTLSTFSSWSIAAGWDAAFTWGICSAVNSGYPFLTAFYSSDPCTGSSPSLAGSSPARYLFTFALPDGRECTSISPVTVTAGSTYALPGADAACAVEGSVVTGWRIPGQAAAFAPGRLVDVSGSQHFTAVLEYSWVNVIFDANVAMSDECLADDSNRGQRETTWSVPRELLLTGTVPVAMSSPCIPPNHTLAGWSTEPAGERTALEFVPVPAVDSDGNAANDVRLYAIWAAN